METLNWRDSLQSISVKSLIPHTARKRLQILLLSFFEREREELNQLKQLMVKNEMFPLTWRLFQRFSAFLVKDTISVCSSVVLLNGIFDYHVSQNTMNQEATILLKARCLVQNKRYTLSRFLYQSFPFHRSIYSFAVFHIYDQLLFFISFLSFVTVCIRQHFFGFTGFSLSANQLGIRLPYCP